MIGARPTDAGLTQEIRFAVAMSGGVSLAVWMGGIAREMNLLQEASNLRKTQLLAGEAGPVPGDGTASRGAAAAAGGPPADGQAADWDAQCRGRYRKLLELLDVTVTMDVLSGTSAGGINAALLGLSSAAGVDLGGLRDLWLTTGSMDMLLRDPGEKAPPSLMQGDKVLFSQLNRGITDFYHGAPRYPAPAVPGSPSTTVFITTTMMSGETSRFTDDYGTLVPDVDHRGLFTFDEQALGAGDGTPALTALALAARSSASFPGAFEPSFVPVNCQVDATQGIPARPDMAPFANMTRSHWAADGGLLANRPLTPLLARVFAQSATGQVRRVLAFVVPDGGGSPHPSAKPVAGDDWTQPPTMAGALRKDLDAQLSQSIASDLQATRSHNQRVNARHGLRRSLAEMGSRLRTEPQPAAGLASDGLVTGRILADYQRQQGDGLAQPLLAELMRQLTTMPIPGAWAAELSPGDQLNAGPVETRMLRAMVRVLGAGWQPARPDGGARPAAADPVQARADEEAAAWAAWQAAGGDPFRRAALFGVPVFLAAQAAAIRLVELGYRCATDRDQRNKLASHRTAIQAALMTPPAGLSDEAGEVRKYLAAVLGQPGHGQPGRPGQPAPQDHPGRPGDLVALAEGLAHRNRSALLIGPDAPASLAGAWQDLAEAVRALLADLSELLESTGTGDSQYGRAGSIRVYLDYFGRQAGPGQLADRLAKLLVAERALLPTEQGVDQPVEFVQFSANTRTLLAPPDHSVPPPQRLDSVSKLRGVELHHFAAFYKSSWRAYDWMWGRLDGCGWLVHILLDPRRILAVVEDRYGWWPPAERAERFATLLRDAAGLPAGLPGDCLAEDLAFLANPSAGLPVSLPNSALFLARAWQGLITANELPVIAERIVADSGRLPPLLDPRAGAPGSQPAAARAAAGTRRAWHAVAGRARRSKPLAAPPDKWVTDMLDLKRRSAPSAAFAGQLASCPVRRETLAGQLRTPAFARLAAKAAAVTAAALTAAPELPGAVRPVLTSARTVTRTGYMATRVTGGSAWKTLLAGLVLAVVGGVLATQGAIVVGLTGTAIALAGLYLFALGAWGLHRGVLGAIVVITAVLPFGLLTLPWIRTQLWGTGRGNTGLVPRDVLPWLRSAWWGGLAMLGGVILLAVLISLLPRARAPRNPGSQRPVTPPPDTPPPAGGTLHRLPLPRPQPAPEQARQAGQAAAGPAAGEGTVTGIERGPR